MGAVAAATYLLSINLATEWSATMNITNKHHVLLTPLVVYSGGPESETGVLPKGTSLRYVESFPEGFDRYVVFVNVERSPFALEEIAPAGLVDPLSAIPGEKNAGEHSIVTIEELKQILRAVGVRRNHLKELLDTYD